MWLIYTIVDAIDEIHNLNQRQKNELTSNLKQSLA